ncbi:MAG: hydroxysqualene dehydroxylase HpnE [Methylotenera sp.]|nr:hydroxysqualene dehydroxylase HpnE [Methylotenera sp.]
MNISNTHVAVIGGGCAGLSAAVALVEKGFKVTVFEASSQLGGRARTVLVENNSLMQLLDNGQHILLGAYRETLSLLHKIGVDEEKVFLRVPLQITMQSTSSKTAFSLKSAQYLPAPLNVLVGLITCKDLSISELIAAIKFMLHIKRSRFQITGDKALDQFLMEHKQSSKLIGMLWEPLCLAALNTPIAIASTRIFLNVLKDSFSSGTFIDAKKNSDFLLPRLDLSKIIANPMAHFIQENGGNIKLNRRIRSLEVEGDGFNLTTRDGKSFFSHVVITVPPARIDKLIESLPKLQNVLKQTQNYGYQPIYTIYLQYPPEIKLPTVMTGLTGTLGQWVFDRGQLCEQKGLMAVIISGSGKHQLLSQDELALTIAKEINQAFPDIPKPLWHKVIAEKRATFSCAPNLARPTNKTLQPRLYLAGDYTYADYPATIEGAIRSGIACANLISNHVE